MAFALTKFYAWRDTVTDVGLYKRAVQNVQLNITATVNDVALDLGTDAGTFWTAALANTTYGVVATKALSILQKIVSAARDIQSFTSPELMDRLQAAVAAGTSYSVAIVNKRPNITFDAANGETAFTVVIRWALLDNQSGYSAQIGS